MTDAVREPRKAGAWYPGRRDQLADLLDRLFAQAPTGAPRLAAHTRWAGLLAPHAGYQYSGATAAIAYASLGAWRPARVVVLAPSHSAGFAGVCAWSPQGGRPAPGHWHTPLGAVPVDDDFLRRLGEESPLIRFGQEGHGDEHSLELQLPFLQHALGGFRLAPLVLGEQSAATVQELGRVLAEVLRTEAGACQTLLVASSDLSHFHSLDVAERLDQRFLDLLADGREDDLLQALAAGSCEACGGGPAVALLSCCRRLMDNLKVVVLDHATSARVNHDESSVVGYCAALLMEAADA